MDAVVDQLIIQDWNRAETQNTVPYPGNQFNNGTGSHWTTIQPPSETMAATGNTHLFRAIEFTDVNTLLEDTNSSISVQGGDTEVEAIWYDLISISFSRSDIDPDHRVISALDNGNTIQISLKASDFWPKVTAYLVLTRQDTKFPGSYPNMSYLDLITTDGATIIGFTDVPFASDSAPPGVINAGSFIAPPNTKLLLLFDIHYCMEAFNHIPEELPPELKSYIYFNWYTSYSFIGDAGIIGKPRN